MAFTHSDPADLPTAVKVLIAGGFGAGKTTLVGAVSEIPPLSTEEYLTSAGVDVDDLDGVEHKTTTTVALDFGRITVNDALILYLFGTPGQDRFRFAWDELTAGALGAVVLADTRRLTGAFPMLDYLEDRGLPFIVAVNRFECASRQYEPPDVQLALNLDPDVPVLLCDARERESAKQVLIRLIELVIHARRRRP